jgi:3-hydroxybutyryl-CoA dehydrogenase
MAISSVSVVGAGTMGNGIAHVFAQHGFQVVLIDLRQELLDRALATIAGNFDRQIAKGTSTQSVKVQALARIRTSTDVPGGVVTADLVVEAATEDKGIKKDLFRRLDSASKLSAILASNTSSISITELAAVTKRPGKVIGMHFMNPVPVMRLVEVIRGSETSDETSAVVRAMCERLEKIPVDVNDSPGFVSNRILMPMINEAISCVEEGVATPQAIDTVMQLGMNHPIGPLALADLIGLDVCLGIMEVLHSGFGDAKYRPSALLVKMVAEGNLGRKSGRGFFDYSKK